jgi:sugar lactone lactonase YvrE
MSANSSFDLLPIPPLELGEGPLWDEARQRFLVMDVDGLAIHAWTPGGGTLQCWRVPERIGWLIARRDGDGFMAGLQSGFARLWLEPALRIERIGSPHAGQAAVRLNDAKADPWGRIWAGSMNVDDYTRADGQLARLDADGGIEVIERGLHICNGPAITADGTWLFHTDSFKARIHRYRLDAQGGLRDKTLWKQFDAHQGTPDGMCFDADGCLWIAFWGGGCVRRFSVEGDRLEQIDLPPRQITSVAFGGPDYATLLVTSARVGLSAAALQAQPLAGATFALRPGVRGLPALGYGSEVRQRRNSGGA